MPLKKQAVVEDHLRATAQNRYQKAIRGKVPLTASPADGQSFVNEFAGEEDSNATSDETMTSSENPAGLPK